MIPVANMKFRKHEYGKVKKEKTARIPPACDVHSAVQSDVNTQNTKLYNIFSKVMAFQAKTGKLIGLSHTLQQYTTADIQQAVSLDHAYSKPIPVDEPREETNCHDRLKDNELIYPINPPNVTNRYLQAL